MTQQEGKHYKFENYSFWAERGMISLVDEDAAARGDEQSHWRIGAGEFLKRAIAARMHHPDLYADKTAALSRLLDEAVAACKLAKAQGDPMDKSTIDTVVRHQRSRQIVMPHELPGMPGHSPMKIKSKGTTPGDTLRDGINVVPDFTI